MPLVRTDPRIRVMMIQNDNRQLVWFILATFQATIYALNKYATTRYCPKVSTNSSYYFIIIIISRTGRNFMRKVKSIDNRFYIYYLGFFQRTEFPGPDGASRSDRFTSKMSIHFGFWMCRGNRANWRECRRICGEWDETN